MTTTRFLSLLAVVVACVLALSAEPIKDHAIVVKQATHDEALSAHRLFFPTVKNTFKKNSQSVYIAQSTDSKELVGMVKLSLETPEALSVSELYVSHEHRKKGVGTMLLFSILDYCVAHPSVKVILFKLDKKNPEGLSFYKSIGAEVIQDHKSYIIMSLKRDIIEFYAKAKRLASSLG